MTVNSLIFFSYREQSNQISVLDLSDKGRPIMNPVITFGQAFNKFRKLFKLCDSIQFKLQKIKI